MKRFLKIVISLILILTLLGGAGWYFGFYNRPLTVEILLSVSDMLNRASLPSLSTKTANWAYSLSGYNPEIAIDVAESYRAKGNYTKAEYTLVNAISRKPSVNLYVALSRTYVEQDKLLDASTMLDKISDPELKAELNAMRPAAPTAQPEQGFYHNYVDVTLSCESGTLYYTTDGTYPSLSSEPYSEPLSLDAGETTINALAVDENGLVSSRVILGYTVDGVIEDVVLSDAALDAYVRQLLSKPSNITLRSDELWSITEMELPEEVKDFSDLARFTGLTSLSIHNATGLDLSFLSGMTDLTALDLSGSKLDRAGLESISALPKLVSLDLSDCQVSNIDPLAEAVGLVSLDLSENSVQNLSALASLTALQSLDLHRNAIHDLSSLSDLKELTNLDVSYNSITSLDALSKCVKLESLNFAENKVGSISVVENFPALTLLNGSGNALTDASPAAKCTALTELYLSDNAIADISAFAALTALQTLDISYNQVTAMPFVPETAALHDLYASHNVIGDISGLKGCENLTNVDLDYNEPLEDVSALESCMALAKLNVYGTKVSDVADLRSREVIVNFDPTI